LMTAAPHNRQILKGIGSPVLGLTSGTSLYDGSLSFHGEG
jgi:hypothetical protein